MRPQILRPAIRAALTSRTSFRITSYNVCYTKLLRLDEFTPATIQRLLLIDYISKIEISKPEFVTSRQETMDLSKLIVYSVLYRQYDDYIFHQILSSDVIKKWNRLNPANIIDEKTHINDNFLRSVLKKNEKIIF